VFLQLWHDEKGTVPGPEWALVVTILVLGAITAAVVSSRQAVLMETEPIAAQVQQAQ
jgi:hypothetical protein